MGTAIAVRADFSSQKLRRLVSESESATAFSLTCAGEPASGIAITLPLRTAQASATAAPSNRVRHRSA
jgi:hypothetical protein